MGCQASTAMGTVDVITNVLGDEALTGAGPDGRSCSRSSFHGEYSLEVKLGQGSFSRVYSCKRVGMGPKEELAVKITDLRAKNFSRKVGVDFEKKAEREAAMLKMIATQDHVSRVVDSLTDGHFHYIVMEKGSSSMFQMLAHMPELTEQSLGKVVRQMFLGVAGIHGLGLVHFDVKPDNFMCFGEEATVKLCDFGLAKKISGSCSVIGTKGTAAFMSPEMITGVNVGAPTDVWSLGVSLYTLLVGQFPYTPSKPDKELMKNAISSGVPEPSYRPTSADVSLSPQALALLKALLCRDSARRPTAAAALEHSWFTLGAGWTPRSLKAVLRSAQNAGACNYGTRFRMDSVDEVLSNLQEKTYSVREALKKAASETSTGPILAMQI